MYNIYTYIYVYERYILDMLHTGGLSGYWGLLNHYSFT